MHYLKRESVNTYTLAVALCFLLLLPSFIYVFFGSTSLALGLMLALPFSCFLTVYHWRLSMVSLVSLFLVFVAIVGFLVFYNYTIISVGRYPSSLKAMYSAFLLGFIVFAALFISIAYKNVSDNACVRSLMVVSLILGLLGFFSIFSDQSLFGYDGYPKSVFPFAEPSHYAIASGPILFAAGFFVNKFWRFVLILFSVFFSLFTPSLIMLLFSALMIFFFYKWGPLKVFLTFMGSIVLFLFAFATDQGAYFIDRLSFSAKSTNITALVYMQGWEDMLVALQDSRWLGIGFQNLGILPVGYYGEAIYTLAGEYKNRNDGGFLAGKIIAELGGLGVLLVCIYLFFFIKSTLFLLRLVSGQCTNRGSALNVFSNAVVVAFFIELFARGAGYFTSGVFLLFVSFFIQLLSRANLKDRC